MGLCVIGKCVRSVGNHRGSEGSERKCRLEVCKTCRKTQRKCRLVS